jgi:hypothetical protein
VRSDRPDGRAMGLRRGHGCAWRLGGRNARSGTGLDPSCARLWLAHVPRGSPRAHRLPRAPEAGAHLNAT